MPTDSAASSAQEVIEPRDAAPAGAARPAPGERPAPAGWARTLGLLALVLAALVAAFHETAWSMVSIWLRSDTFAHGFLIVPISLWLVWEKRRGLRALRPEPAYLPLLLMVPIGLGWLLGNLVDVLVVQQFGFVGMLILAIWSVIGTPTARYLAFPILFLFFGVPVGEGLIYPMMNFTADFTVGMLRLTGIPVYRDGTFFSIPSGDWSVVEACSGVRYLIASVTLGALYAYLTYTKLWKRALFVAVSIVVPIIANGFRAYLIVMIAHMSDMKLAVGVDHLIYGWVFFGIIITILFFVGSFWRDEPAKAPLPREGGSRRGRGAASALIVALAAVLVAGLWPGLAWTLGRDGAPPAAVTLAAPAATGPWAAEGVSLWDWRPDVQGPDGELFTFYRGEGNRPVGLYLGVYRSQRQGAELVNSQNVMVVQKHPVWSEKELTQRRVRLGGEEIPVFQSRLSSVRGERLLIWHWYRIGSSYTANAYVGKLLEAVSRLTQGRRDGALIAVSVPYLDRADQAAEVLQAFIDDQLPAIEAEIDRALGRES